MSYINKPYTFKSEEEFQQFVQTAKIETLDCIYNKVKSIWTNDQHRYYCCKYLPISWSMEEGQGTICEDEADNIDEDTEKMRIDKNGYTTGYPVLRTDTSSGRKQQRYNTFCFKAFGAEKTPDSVRAKGFNQRIVELPCVYGFPEYDISEVINPAGEQKYEELLNELNDTRNLLLVYRLLHFKDKIPDIRLNIENREKQLFKPLIRVFQHTDALKELLPILSKYVRQKRENNANSLHAYLYKIVKDLIEAQKATEIESSLIWSTIKESLAGRPNSFQTTILPEHRVWHSIAKRNSKNFKGCVWR